MNLYWLSRRAPLLDTFGQAADNAAIVTNAGTGRACPSIQGVPHQYPQRHQVLERTPLRAGCVASCWAHCSRCRSGRRLSYSCDGCSAGSGGLAPGSGSAVGTGRKASASTTGHSYHSDRPSGTAGCALLVRRHPTRTEELAYHLVHAPEVTAGAEAVRAAGLRWAIEDTFQLVKGQASLDHYYHSDTCAAGAVM